MLVSSIIISLYTKYFLSNTFDGCDDQRNPSGQNRVHRQKKQHTYDPKYHSESNTSRCDQTVRVNGNFSNGR